MSDQTFQASLNEFLSALIVVKLIPGNSHPDQMVENVCWKTD
jgi:hypothetical protein